MKKTKLEIQPRRKLYCSYDI